MSSHIMFQVQTQVLSNVSEGRNTMPIKTVCVYVSTYMYSY